MKTSNIITRLKEKYPFHDIEVVKKIGLEDFAPRLYVYANGHNLMVSYNFDYEKDFDIEEEIFKSWCDYLDGVDKI